jgi:hypothetical protein
MENEETYSTIKTSKRFELDVALISSDPVVAEEIGGRRIKKYQAIDYAVRLTATRIRKGLDIRQNIK